MMKIMRAVVSLVLVLTFSVSSVSFAAEPDISKLSPPSKFSSFTALQGVEFREAAQVQVGIRRALRGMTGIDLVSLRAIGSRAFIEQTVFTTTKISGTLEFDETAECQIHGDRVVIEDGAYLVKARVQDRAYYALVSMGPNGALDVSVAPQRLLDEALKDGVVTFTHASIQGTDKAGIDAYVAQEFSPDGKKAIDEVIAPRMEAGEYLAQNVNPQWEALYRNTEAELSSDRGLTAVFESMARILHGVGVKPENVAEIMHDFTQKTIVYIPVDSFEDLPVTMLEGREGRVGLHASKTAVYIFVKRDLYDMLKRDDVWDAGIAGFMEDNFLHEIGALCGLSNRIHEGDVVGNALDVAVDAYKKDPARYAPTGELADLKPVDLDNLALRSDYAMVTLDQAKSYFTRAMALTLAGVMGVFPACTKSAETPAPAPQQSVVLAAPASTTVIPSAEEITEHIVHLKSQVPDERTKAQDVLIKIGQPAVKPLVQALRDDAKSGWAYDYTPSRGAFRGITSDVTDLLDYDVENNLIIHDPVVKTLISIGRKTAGPLLIPLLQDEDDRTRGRAAYILGQIGYKEAYSSILPLISDKNETVRKHAATAIGRTGGTRAIPTLRGLVRGSDDRVSSSAAAALGETGSAAMHDITVLMQDSDPVVRGRAAFACGKTGDAQAILFLRKMAAEDSDPQARSNAISALQAVGTGEAIDIIKKIGASEKHPMVLAYINMALSLNAAEATRRLKTDGQITAADSFEAIVESLEGPLAAQARAELVRRGASVVKPLLDLVALDKGPHDNRRKRREAVIGMLIDMTGRSAKDELVRVATSHSVMEVRTAAAVALAKRGALDDGCFARMFSKDGLMTDYFLAGDALRDLKAAGPAIVESYFTGVRNAQIPENVREAIAGELGLLQDTRAYDVLINLAAAENEPSSLRIIAVKMIDRQAGQKAVAALMNILRADLSGKDQSSLVIEACIEQLGRLDAKQAVDIIIPFLKSDSADTRRQAAMVLGEFGDPKAVTPIADALGKEKEYTAFRNDALAVQSEIEALAQLRDTRGTAALLRFAERCEADEEDLKTAAVEALGIMQDKAATPFLCRLLKDPNEMFRFRAVCALHKILDPTSTDALLAALKDEYYLVRMNAAWALGHLKESRAISGLVDLLGDEEGQVSSYAVSALIDIGDRKAVELGLRYLSKKPIRNREEIETFVSGFLTVCFSIKTATSPDTVVAILENKVSAAKKTEGAPISAETYAAGVERIIALFTDATQPINKTLAAACALITLRDPRAVESLVKGLSETTDQEQRDTYIMAIGSIDDVKAINALERMVKTDPEVGIRSKAAGSFAVYKDQKTHTENRERITRLLADALKNDKSEEVRIYAAYAVAQIGARDAETVLAAALQDPSENVREKVKELIEIVKHPVEVVEIDPYESKPGSSESEGDTSSRMLETKPVVKTEDLVKDTTTQPVMQSIIMAQADGAMPAPVDEVQTQRLKETMNDFFDRTPAERQKAAQDLDALGWKPQTMDERVVYLAVKNDWKEIIRLGDAALDPLVRLAKEPRLYRNMVAYTLGLIGNEKAIDALIRLLGDDSDPSGSRYSPGSKHAFSALMFIGKPAADALLAEIKPDGGTLAYYGIEMLGLMNDPRPVKKLEDLMLHDRTYVLQQSGLGANDLSLHKQSIDSLAMLAANGNKAALASLERALASYGEKEPEELNERGVKDRIQRALASAKAGETETAVAPAVARVDGKAGIDKRKLAVILANETLTGSRWVKIKFAAAELLGLLGTKEDVPILITALTASKEDSIKAAAARALGDIGDPAALSYLAEAAESRDYSLSEAAKQAIEKIRNAQKPSGSSEAEGEARKEMLETKPVVKTEDLVKNATTQPVMQTLAAEAAPQQEQAAKGGITIDALRKDLTAADPAIRQRAVQGLEAIGPEAVNDIATVLTDKDPAVRKQAIESLSNIASTQAVAFLKATAKDATDQALRVAAVRGLEKIGTPEAAEFLVTLLIDANVEADVAVSLVKIGELAVPPLIAVLDDPRDDMRAKAADVLIKQGKTIVPALITALEKETPGARAYLIGILGDIGDTRAVEPLLRVERKDLEPLRVIAIAALGALGDQKAVPDLIAALKDTSATIRSFAASALGDLKATAAIPALEALEQDGDKEVRDAAKAAIDKIKGGTKSMKEEHARLTAGADVVAERMWRLVLDPAVNSAVRQELDGILAVRQMPAADRKETIDALLSQAALLGAGVVGATQKQGEKVPDGSAIRQLAARIQAEEIEVYIPSAYLINNMSGEFRRTLEQVFGDRLVAYQDVADLGSLIKHPANAIVMTVDLDDSAVAALAEVKDAIHDVRFMNFEEMKDLRSMSKAEYQNYMAETLSILLVARTITREEAMDHASAGYRLLSGLLGDHLADVQETAAYITALVDTSVDPVMRLRYLIKAILKAMPVKEYKIMKPAVEVLWSA